MANKFQNKQVKFTALKLFVLVALGMFSLLSIALSFSDDFSEEIFASFDGNSIQNKVGDTIHFFPETAVKAKVAKYQKKHKHLNDSSVDFHLYQKKLTARLNLVLADVSGYKTPYFRSRVYSFLYRLTYF
ncbi:hypothetical protein ACJVDH_03830 [Pedobacter sp. AW1-32]|uniref:hypothetical protein n=1 Tax=Pedobacter sp. AW1-32 TaxID=3383026 RepID=UPI003FEF8C72